MDPNTDLPVCFNMSNIFAWKTGSTASTLTPWKTKYTSYEPQQQDTQQY